ncbi:hypothetical protein SPB21_07035 [Leptothoe sp. ISB3NOV94-8A]
MTGYILPLSPSVVNTSENTAKDSNIDGFRQNIFANYSLKWRQNILWVAPHSSGKISLPVSTHQLVNRLQHSPVRCVCINSGLGEAHLNVWKEACSKAGKRLHVRVPKNNKTTAVTSWNRMMKRSCQRLVAYIDGVKAIHV